MSAIAYMHSINVVHRDLKMDNIIVDESNNNLIKIIDFGFATACGKDEKLGVQCGTTHYMCPDLVKKQMVNCQAADIWACGVILYILVIGKMPFYAANELDLFRRIQTIKYKFPTKFDDEDEEDRSISPAAQRLIRSIFVRDASKRPTAANILEDPWLKNQLGEVRNQTATD